MRLIPLNYILTYPWPAGLWRALWCLRKTGLGLVLLFIAHACFVAVVGVMLRVGVSLGQVNHMLWYMRLLSVLLALGLWYWLGYRADAKSRLAPA